MDPNTEISKVVTIGLGAAGDAGVRSPWGFP